MKEQPHPLAEIGIGITKSRVWFGMEVEGKLRQGLWTAFISSPALEDTLFARLESGTVQHIFLTELFCDWEWFEKTLLPSARLIPITVARYANGINEVLNQPWASRVDLMVRADETLNVERLRPNDQVSVGQPYNLITWRVGDGLRTMREDYAGDVL